MIGSARAVQVSIFIALACLFVAATAAAVDRFVFAVTSSVISFMLTALAMRGRCSTCSYPMLKNASGLWTPFVGAKCSTCGQLYEEVPDQKLVKPSSVQVQLYTGLAFFFGLGTVAAVAMGFFDEGVHENAALIWLPVFYIFLLSIYFGTWPYARHGKLRRLSRVVGVLIAVLTAVWVIGLLYFSDYAKAVTLAVFFLGFVAAGKRA